MATLVKFYIENENEVLAFFPQLNWSKELYGNNTKTCYAHVGQHSACKKEYVKDLKPVTNLNQCLDLIHELNSIGYELKILNKFS
jgi:hypothetical protein